MIQAEPNRTKCRIRIIEKKGQDTVSNKTLLEIEILPDEIQEDKRFIKPGEIMKAFTFDQIEIKEGRSYIAEAEYIGGPSGGNVHLKNLQPKY